jgi:hypothetical protein
MRVCEQEPCLVAFLDEAERPSAEVGPVRPQLRFSGSAFHCTAAVKREEFSEASICFLS